MKTVFSSIVIDEKDFGKQAIITQTGFIFLEKEPPLSEKVSTLRPNPTSLKVPIFADIIGGTDVLLGSPAGFLDITISGIVRQIPYY